MHNAPANGCTRKGAGGLVERPRGPLREVARGSSACKYEFGDFGFPVEKGENQ